MRWHLVSVLTATQAGCDGTEAGGDGRWDTAVSWLNGCPARWTVFNKGTALWVRGPPSADSQNPPRPPPPPVPAVHTSIVLQWTISQTQPTTRWCNEYSSSWMIYWTPDLFIFLNICRLVGSSTAGLWTSSHTAFVFMCVPDLCSYAGCCWLLGLGDMRPGCDITGEERQK